MIIRIQFLDRENNKVVHPWCLFEGDERLSLRKMYDGIYDDIISCGRKLNLESYEKDDILASSLSSTRKSPSPSELMPTPLSLSSYHLKENDSSLYIQFEIKLKEADTDINIDCSATDSAELVVEPHDTVTHSHEQVRPLCITEATIEGWRCEAVQRVGKFHKNEKVWSYGNLFGRL